MSDNDHAAAIRALTGQRYLGYHLSERINHHADALAAENAALRAYAQTLEKCMVSMEGTIHPDVASHPKFEEDYTRGLRDANNVAHLFDAEGQG